MNSSRRFFGNSSRTPSRISPAILLKNSPEILQEIPPAIPPEISLGILKIHLEIHLEIASEIHHIITLEILQEISP